ncbi:MAG: hypothetical protein ACXVH7_04215 [Thermoanaerobaculia bacterium]
MSLIWLPIIVISGAFVVAIVAITHLARTRQRRAELQAEVQTKLIDRFNSAPELVDFLRSPTGQEFVSGVKARQAGAVNRKVIGGIRTAVFTGVLGAGFLLLWGLAHEEGFMYPGIILLTIGGGIFLSTLVSVKLSRDWGLTDEPTKTQMPTSAGDVR